MRHSEYERRRRALERQLHDDLALIRAGYQAKLRALEMIWLASPGAEGAANEPEVDEIQAPEETPAGSETLAPSETQPSSEAQSETQDLGETQEVTWMVRPGGLRHAVQEVLPRLPEVFDKYELIEALGFEPRRSTLLRVIDHLLAAQQIKIAQHSRGRRATKYRKVAGQA